MTNRRVPLVFPSRNKYAYDPAVSNRQLWAIGMIVVQWSMTEWFIDMNTRNLIGNDQDVLDEFKKQRNFQNRLDFWQAQIGLKAKEPHRSKLLSLIPRIQSLNTQRDEVVHRLWAGGMEGSSPSSAGLESNDAGLMPKPGEKLKTKASEGPIPFTWNATFPRLRRMATEMADLNRDLLQASVMAGPPHGYVDTWPR